MILGLRSAPRMRILVYEYLKRVLGNDDSDDEVIGMAKRRKVSNLLALSLLTLLTERPMYPYEMAATLRERGKDQAIKINWGSLYTVVQNLEKYGFIEAVEVAREGRQPERTTYQITDAGRAELKDWLRELLSVPEREYTRFEAALGESAVLPPDELIDLLQQRLDALEAANAEHQAGLDALVSPDTPALPDRIGVLPGAAPGRGGVGAGAAEGVHRRHVPRHRRLAALPRHRGRSRRKFSRWSKRKERRAADS